MGVTRTDGQNSLNWKRTAALALSLSLRTLLGLMIARGACGQHLQWIRFEDPLEDAFSVDIPRGWTVRGGLFRLGLSDIRPMVDLVSPDGRINIRLGDVSVPLYSVPGQSHIIEGEPYDLGAQARMIVARYRTGPEFAVLYSHARFVAFCRKPAADAADVDFVMPDYVPMDASASQTSSGQIAYRCDSDQGPRVAFAYARTDSYGTFWQVHALASFLSPPEQASLARGVLLHAAHSFQLQAQWLGQHNYRDTPPLEYQRRRQQLDAFRHQQSAQGDPLEAFNEALRGVTPTVDPLTGEGRNVWGSPHDNYWTNGIGEVIDSQSAPSLAWRRLEVTSPH